MRLYREGQIKLKNRLLNFFAGRNGMDSIGKLATWSAILLLIISIVLAPYLKGILSSILWWLALAVMAYGYWRMLSRNVYKRRAENDRYLAATEGIRGFFRGRAMRFSQRKDYRFFKCPGCGATLRVPKGKGKIQITCRKCGNRFSAKS